MACILSRASIMWRAVSYKSIIFGPVNRITLTRGCKHLTNKTNIYAERRFKLKDNINNDYRLVYREHTVINLTIGTAYNAGWIGIFLSTCLGGYLFYADPPVQKEGTDKEYIFKPLGKVGRVVLLIVGIITCCSVIFASSIIPYRIYHSRTQKLYKAIFANMILGKKQILTFAEGTAVPKFKRKFMTEVLFDINGRTVLLDPECFPVPDVRERMIHKTV